MDVIDLNPLADRTHIAKMKDHSVKMYYNRDLMNISLQKFGNMDTFLYEKARRQNQEHPEFPVFNFFPAYVLIINTIPDQSHTEKRKGS